jgi:hypothetical protein
MSESHYWYYLLPVAAAAVLYAGPRDFGSDVERRSIAITTAIAGMLSVLLCAVPDWHEPVASSCSGGCDRGPLTVTSAC